uniref:Uncharacterized protein n=1 Tax=Hordeum vulgare subsp. vulgare TaxID=112509 RepID=A0A8I6YS26_HORVV
MVKPEHQARQGPTKRRHRQMRGRKAPSAPRRHSRTAWQTRERACRFDVKVDGFDSAKIVRPQLRSEIGEVRGSLERISIAEFLAHEAAVQGDAAAEPSSSPSSKAATRDANPLLSITCDSAVHAVAGKGPSSSSPKAPPHGAKRLLLTAAEPRPEAPATPVLKSMKTIPSTGPPTSTPRAVTFQAFHVVPPERPDAEPAVLVRASHLKIRFAGIIAKAKESMLIRHRQDLERRPAAGIDETSRGLEVDAEDQTAREGEALLQQQQERNARVAVLRRASREALREVERNARHTGLSRETIHPVQLKELGITDVEHGRPGAPKHCLPSNPLEELGLFMKPVNDGGEEGM